jgi:hypothetical protein
MFWKRINKTAFVDVLFLVVISGLVYLPWIKEMTYNKDDWYFLFGGLVGGPEFFSQVALHTRPIRGPLYELYFPCLA